MATSNFADNLSAEGAMEGQNDPFIALTPERDPRHRYSTFDSQVFALGPNASPAQAKRALEAHLAETDRRMEEAGKLGTALVQQRNELEERLREVEKLEAEGQLSQELRQKLVEIEKDYNEVARESARAFLPKPRVPSNEAAAGSPYVPEGKGGRRSVSPSKFEAQATGSPTKFSVPNRKVRNQPTNRIHDIEFAAEISTSLIAQVRNLQGLLAEKEEELRDVKLEKSKLEYDAEGFQQRIKVLDESESRYKDENWSLETQVHELMASQKESSDREKKLQQTINILQSEKNTAQRELDEVKASHSKLSEEHVATVKHLDTEMGAAKRNMAAADTDRVLMQRRIDELTSQNQELAKAVSSQRGRLSDRQEILTMSDGDFETAHDGDTPEHSPPPSPVKGTPRHSLLESETLKTSLHHAQRTIQSLRTNVHREKTEKLELRRMLQDARDELEKTRNDPLASSKRARKADSREFKKSARLLGNLRSARSEIFTEDPNWEDQIEADSPNRLMYTHSQRGSSSQFEPVMESIEHDDFETAAETSDQAFETANERGTGTETDDFHTGAEEFSSEDDTETETESPSKRRIGTFKGRPPSLSLGGVSLARSNSLHSTASTEDEYSYVETKTPAPQLPELKGKFQLRVSRSSARRSRQFSEEHSFTSSPASFVTSSAAGTPQPQVQTLAAELGDFDGSDNDSTVSATPSRRSTLMSSRPGSIRGVTASPPPPVPPLPKVIMIDSGMMTEPVPELLSPPSPSTVVGATPLDTVHESGSEDGGVELEENLAKFPAPPMSPKKEVAAHAAEIEALRQEHAEQIEKIRAENAAAHEAALEAVKAGHADELTRSLGEAKSSHVQEIDVLKTSYADDLNRSLDEVRASHAKEIEALTASHVEQLSRSRDEARTSYLQELDAVKATHGDEITRSLDEARGFHSQEMEGLKTSHADQLARSVDEVKAAHALEIESLKSSFAELSSKSAGAAVDAHARELEALQATHAAKLAQIEVESKAAHLSELESLKASHLEQLEFLQKQSDAILAEHSESFRQKSEATLTEKLESLRKESDAVHAEQMESLQKQSDATHAEELARLQTAHAAQIELATKELELLKAGHIEQIELAQKTTDSAHAEELEALKLAYLGQVEETKNSIVEAHTRELEALAAAHATQIEQSKKETEAAHNLEVEALIASHLAQLESSKTDAAQQLAKEIESLKAVQQNELESSKAESAAALAKEIDALNAFHATELALSKAEGETKLAKEIETLRTAHAQEIETLNVEHDATLARELASLKAAHGRQLEESKTRSDAAQAATIAVLVSQHAKQLESTKSEADATLSRELAAVKNTHAHKIDELKTQHAAAHAEELEAFKAALAKQVESSKSEGDVAHSRQIEALNAAHAEIVEAHKRDSEKAMEQALESLKASHERQIETLKRENATAKSKELDDLSIKHGDELDMVKAEYIAAKTLEIETLVSKHDSDLEAVKAQAAADKANIIEALVSKHSRELEAVRAEIVAEKIKEIEMIVANHSNEIEVLRSDAAATTAKEIETIISKHNGELEMVRSEAATTKTKELEELSASHNQRIEQLNAELAATKAKALEELEAQHASQIVELKNETTSSKSKELDDLTTDHSKQIQALKADHNAAIAKLVEELSATHAVKMDAVRAENEAAKAKELESLRAALQNEFEAEQANELDRLKSEHALALDRAKAEHETALNAALQNLMATHAQEINTLKNDDSVTHTEALNSLQSSHVEELDALKAESAASLARELDAVKAEHQQLLQGHQMESSAEIEKLLASHAQQIDALENEHSATHVKALDSLQSKHAQELEAIKAESAACLAHELDLLKAEHQRALEAQQEESATSLTRELDAAKTEHQRSLEAHRSESSAEREKMVANHALELEALRKSLTLKRPALNYSTTSTVETEPIEAPTRSPKREAFIIPRESEQPRTPPSSSIGIFGKKGKSTDAPMIAEDETRQSPNAARGPETPESQRPFKEMSNNTDARPRKQAMATPTHDQGAQTMLTSDALGKMLLVKQRRDSQGSFVEGGSPATIRHRRSQDGIGSVIRTKGKMNDTGVLAGPEPIPGRRPGSSASGWGTMQDAPPLPANHKEAIEAARIGPPAQTSGNPGKASMGPPLLPASAYKNAATATRPRTPHDNQPQPPPLSPTSGRGTPTPRPVRTGSSQGYAEIHSPTKMTARSRQSSVSSFASEIETRFNIRGDMSMEAAGLAGPGTDPRMIQAITQTMIGEYLWKYTRKTGRGEMSENRHRRYFWVHPYTRTLYWSDRDPSSAAGGRSELKAKSVPIEAVRVVTDDNPMPPGLHRKSLIILSPGRTVKFTCTTGQRHETWFNALSYLLLRTGDEGQADTEEMANNITQEDVDEFNPQFGRRPPTTQSNRPRAPPSISSYNSRTTRNESPNVDFSMSIPTLTPTHERHATKSGTLGRLSGYWKNTASSGNIFHSLRGRSHPANIGSAIYEASEVHDSAEDLRQMIEQQDRESDRLENVRACCDGKHDVGTLSHSSKRNRQSHSHSHTHTHPGQPTTPTPMSTVRSRA